MAGPVQEERTIRTTLISSHLVTFLAYSSITLIPMYSEWRLQS
jgi:hypothetical protein